MPPHSPPHDPSANFVREVPCPLVVVDKDGRVVLWNSAAERLLGHDEPAVLGRSWSSFLNDGAPVAAEKLVLRHRNGHDIAVTERPAPRIAPAIAPEGGRAFFLEPGSNLLEATQLVLRNVLQLLPAFFSIIGADRRYRTVCRSCELLFGRPRCDIEGQLVSDMFGSEVFAKVGPLLERAFAGESTHGEFQARGADGRVHFLHVHLHPLNQSGAAIEAVFAFAYEITELRETEATLRESESRLKFLIANNPDLIVLVGRDFKLRFINHTEPDPSIRPEELVGIDVLQLSPPEYRNQVRLHYETVWRTGKPLDVEAPILWRGQMRWFSSRLVSLPNGDHPPDEILVVSREITQRIAVEQALRESEARFRQFAEAIDDVVWIHDANPDQVKFVNQSFERIWGVSRQHLYDDPQYWVRTVHAEDRERVRDHWNDVVEGRIPFFDVEYRILRPDGAIRWIHDSGVTIRDDQGRPVRLSGIAHDFNNLLAGILNNVNLAQMELGATPGVRARLEQIEIITQRAGDLCKQMLAYAGKGRFVVGLLDINNLIADISPLVGISISKKATLDLDLAPKTPAIRGDGSQLRQVLLNLIINASEAFGEQIGSIRISTGVRTIAADDLSAFQPGADARPGTYVFLEVKDNGPGMAPDVVKRIFEPFFTTKFTGRGLGLAAVQGIMRSHGGAVRVVSRVGSGTTFTLLLPLAQESRPPVAEPLPPGVPLHRAGEVLIVDDEEIIRSTLTLMLESFGFSVLTASDGREAVEIYKHRHAHLKLVLLDLTMPILSGEESHAEMVRIDPKVPIIFMSGYMEQEIADRSHGDPIAGFLQKPFHIDVLEQLLARVIDSTPPNAPRNLSATS
ncbi:MAG: PAS domain-containing protein [Planctomycetota bacterium]